MLYITPPRSKMAATRSAFEMSWPAAANSSSREDDLYRSARNSVLESWFEELFTFLDKGPKLAKLDSACMNKLRNINMWLLANGRKPTRIEWRTWHQLCKSFLSDLVHPLYSTLCCALVRNIHLKAESSEDCPNFSQPLYLWKVLSEYLSPISSGSNYATKPTNEPCMHFSPLELSSVYNGYGDEKSSFVQNIMDSFACSLSSILLETTVYYQSSTSGLFSGGKRQPLIVKELDGSPSQDCFTLLNSAPLYSDNQLLNIHGFSVLKRLLFLSFDGSMASSEFTKKDALDCIRKYCLRLLEQCERKPLVSMRDGILLESVFSECLSILSILCAKNEQIGHSIFHTARALCFSIRSDERQQKLSLFALTFLLNYGNGEAFHMDSAIVEIFRIAICDGLQNQCAGYEVMDFLLKNKEKLTSPVNYIERFFPSILKIAAWFPCSFVDELMELLPLITTAKTAAEVFHAILDLPCTAAVLELRATMESNVPDGSPYKHCLESLNDMKFQIIYDFFLRDESGKGDTVDFLSPFLTMLAPFCDNPRITALSQVTPVYLKKFFTAVIPLSTSEIASSLITGMLERVLVILGPSDSIPGIRSTLARNILALVKCHPMVIVLNQAEIVDFVMLYQNYTATGDFYNNLIWILGEYSSFITVMQSPASNVIHMKYHECLESVAYEAALMSSNEGITQDSQCFAKVLLVLMGSLAKVAAMCQELIPRVLLCLNKVVQQIVESPCDKDSCSVLLCRASELINILKMPNVAVSVLSGHQEMKYSHGAQNCAFITFLIDRTSKLAK